jgi:hypothetical protein
MTTLLANAAIEMALAALIGAAAAVLTSIANGFNARAKLMEVNAQVQQHGQQINQLTAAQTAMQAVASAQAAPSVQGPPVIQLPPVPAAPAPAGASQGS